MTREDDTRPVESLEARYANHFRVGHNAYEFVFDFGQFYVEMNEPQMHTRIVTSPAYAKDLSRTLGESLERYESSFGPITDRDDDGSPGQ